MTKRAMVLVAGGTGYIGTHTTVELIEAGYDVMMVDNLSNSDPSMHSRVEKIVGLPVPFINADSCDRKAMDDIFSEHEIDAVIHFAAFKAVGESVFDPLKYFDNNLTSLIVVLETMRKHNVNNLVFSSSATVYGQPCVLPVTEQTPRQKANSP